MNSQTKVNKDFFKRVLISACVAYFSFFLLHFLLAFALAKIQHFENYMNLSSWAITLLTSLISALTARKDVINVLSSSTLLSVLLIPTAFAFGGEKVDFALLFLRIGVIVLSALLFTFILISTKQKQSRRSKKFKFQA